MLDYISFDYDYLFNIKNSSQNCFFFAQLISKLFLLLEFIIQFKDGKQTVVALLEISDLTVFQ
jgi:hypothetical protein